MIRAYITGDAEVIGRLRRLPVEIRASLIEAVEELAIDLVAHVKGRKLTGQVLNVRSGRLRRSIHHDMAVSGSSISATVGTNVEYASAHEYGFSGPVKVKEHLRRLKSGQTATVGAHTRHMNIPERSFLRSSLRDMRGQIQRELHAAAVKAIRRR